MTTPFSEPVFLSRIAQPSLSLSSSRVRLIWCAATYVRNLIKDHVRGVITRRLGVITLEELNRTVKEHVLTQKVLRILIGAGKGISTPIYRYI